MRKPNRRRSPWEELSHLAHSEKFIDRAKTVLIAALVVSAAVLLARLGMFELGGPKQSGTDAAAGQNTQQHGGSADIDVAGPYVIVVTDAAGSHCGLMYDGTELKQAYDRLSAYLGEAFGSAGEPKSVSEEDFHAALKEQGVYFDFAYAQPLTVLASAIGTTMTSTALNHSAAGFCLAVEGDTVALYYLRDKDRGYYRCDTAISGAALESKLADWPSNGASYLFETDYGYNLVDSCFVVLQGQAQLHSVTAQNPVGGSYDPSGLAALFGINSYMASHYTEADGTDVYVDGDSILRIYTDGSVSFKDPDAAGTAAGDSGLAGALAVSASAAASTVGSAGGVASVRLSYVSYDTDAGAYTVRYSYEIGGCPVTLGGRSAASFTVVDGVITAAELNFRTYSYSGAGDAPLPAVQAMAVVQAKGGGMPLLCYVDDGASVAAGWTILS